jgi:hypothetical protein
MLDRALFRYYDVSEFPVVRIAGRDLPHGYITQWITEIEALLAQGEPFVLIFLNTVQSPAHEDQKGMMLWIKAHKRELARLCRVMISIEPDRMLRIAKRAQGLAIVIALGFRFAVVADAAKANELAMRALAGETVSDGDE